MRVERSDDVTGTIQLPLYLVSRFVGHAGKGKKSHHFDRFSCTSPECRQHHSVWQ